MDSSAHKSTDQSDLNVNRHATEYSKVAPTRQDGRSALLGLRGISAILVVLYHCGLLVRDQDIGLLGGLVRHGYLAVDLFFVISGYVISKKYLALFLTDVSPASVGRFALLRLSRIYPAYFAWVMVSAALWLVLAANGADETRTIQEYAVSVLMHVLMMQSLIWSPIHFNIPLWSIAVECLAYAAFPLVALAFRRWTGRSVTIVLATFFLVSTVWLSVPTIDRIEGGWSALRCLSGFLAGVAVFKVETALRSRLVTIVPNLQLFACATTVLAVLFGLEVAAVLCFAVLVLSMADTMNVDGLPSRILKTNLLQWLGDLSYSIYLSHVVVLTVMIWVLGKLNTYLGQYALPQWPTLPVAVLIGSFLAAALSRALIERPSMIWLRSWTGSRSSVA